MRYETNPESFRLSKLEFKVLPKAAYSELVGPVAHKSVPCNSSSCHSWFPALKS